MLLALPYCLIHFSLIARCRCGTLASEGGGAGKAGRGGEGCQRDKQLFETTKIYIFIAVHLYNNCCGSAAEGQACVSVYLWDTFNNFPTARQGDYTLSKCLPYCLPLSQSLALCVSTFWAAAASSSHLPLLFLLRLLCYTCFLVYLLFLCSKIFAHVALVVVVVVVGNPMQMSEIAWGRARERERA